ncbi:peroxiredoxin family protein [Promicromonospora sp. CA-289599]|uniref:peroxiredoxin family protein n=1 Tax=Promicromonospora sp. CA-289599 TaxID=3240014 RepID=UPI003D8ED32B
MWSDVANRPDRHVLDRADHKETAMPLLSPGDSFPSLTLTRPGGQTLALPDAFSGSFGVVLFYRGSWCPYCNAQLRAFQRAGERLAEAGIKVAALSADDEATTVEQIARHGLTFPVGHSADTTAISAATGAFVNPDPAYLQSTGFVLDRSGDVIVSVYSSGAIGRLVPEDVIGLVHHVSNGAG